MPPEGVEPLTVSVITNRIKLRLEEHFPTVWVVGEVSNLVRHQSGHWYFSLKDAGAVIRCMMRVGFNMRLKFDPRNGMEVIVRGQISLYPAQGSYQIYVDELHPKGEGAAELALRELRDKLRRKGYFEEKRKRPLPKYPRWIGLIASPTGAAIRDMLEIVTLRWPLAEVVVRPSRVQGEGAGSDVARALQQLSWLQSKKLLPFDAIVIGRGGGSREDLAAFNEECVADAIFNSSVPVVSAVGHETDVSVADLVADVRALTPSDAIRQLCPDRRELMDGLILTGDRLREAIENRIKLARQRIGQFADRPALRRPLDRVRELEQRLDDTETRLLRAATLHVEQNRRRLDAAAGHLEGLSPLKVLRRGYSLTRMADGVHLIRSAADVKPGDTVITRVADGEFYSRVEAVGERHDD